MSKALSSEKFIWRLFPKDNLKTFVILDGALIDELLPQLDAHAPVYRCLYRGKLENGLDAVAPYLVELEEGNAFTDWILSEGWGKNWGIFLTADESTKIDPLCRHFRKLNKVKESTGKSLLFRYYDPRVLRVLLPTCEAEQLPSFFELVESFICEDEDPGQVVCLQVDQDSGLVRKEIFAFEATGS